MRYSIMILLAWACIVGSMQCFATAGFISLQFNRSIGGFSNLNGIGVDESGNILTTDSGFRRVQVRSQTGSILATRTLPSGSVPTDIAQSGSAFYVTDNGFNAIREITHVGSNLQEQTVFSSQGPSPKSIAALSSGNLVVADDGTDRIYTISTSGSAISNFGPGFQDPVGVAITNQDEILVTGVNRLGNYTPSGTSQWTQFFSDPNGAAVDSVGNIYLADGFGQRLRLLNSGGGQLSSVSSSGFVEDVEWAPNGRVIASWNNQLRIYDTQFNVVGNEAIPDKSVFSRGIRVDSGDHGQVLSGTTVSATEGSVISVFNGGRLELLSGSTLNLNSLLVWDGGVSGFPGGIFEADGSTINASSSLRVDSEGQIDISDSQVDVAADLEVDGTTTARIDLSGGTIDLSRNMLIGRDGLGIATLSQAAIAMVEGELHVGSDVGGDGSVAVGSGSLLDVTGMLGNISGRVTIGGSGEGSVAVNGGGSVNIGTELRVGETASGNGSIIVTGTDSTWTNAGDLFVGYSGVGTLDVLSGGEVTSARGFLGHLAGSEGTATVDGNGSTWTNSGNLIVGNNGNGALDITNGGAVSANRVALGQIDANQGSTGDGAALVDGMDSSLTSTGEFDVGDHGDGTLVIQNGGMASADGRFNVAREVGSTGAVTIDGSGSRLMTNDIAFIGNHDVGTFDITNGGTVSSVDSRIGNNNDGTGTATVNGSGSIWANSGQLLVGVAGDGTLNIANGGSVEVANSAPAIIARDSGSTGNVTVDAAGSTWNNSGSLYVGGDATQDGGAGTLTISNNGRVTVDDTTKLWGANDTLTLNGGTLTTGSFENTGGGTFNFDDGELELNNGTSSLTSLSLNGLMANDLPILRVTGGATSVNITNQLFVGDATNGVLNIENGAVVTNTSGAIGSILGSVGTATVTGSGTQWKNSSILYVGGNSSNGTIDIEDGGSVTNTAGIIGFGSGSTGEATVSGTGSLWDNSSQLDVGRGGNGTLNIEAGGVVRSNAGYIGRDNGSSGLATVTGNSSQWNISSNLFVGRSGDGVLNVEAGGVVRNTIGVIGQASSSSGVVTVTGSGSLWDNSSLFVGGSPSSAAGAGTLAVRDGGTVSVGFDLRIWNTGSIEVELDGATGQPDLLQVTGSATLDGVLNVSLPNGYYPTGGETLAVIDASVLSGAFATENLPVARGGVSFDVVYDALAGDVTVNVLGMLGDVDLDGDVDWDDIDTLAANVGSLDPLYDLDGDGLAATFAASVSGVSSDSDYLIRTILGTNYGDANLDGKIDILDLDLLGQGYRGQGTGWLFGDFDGSGGATGINDLTILGQTYGQPIPLSALGVPEPGSCVLAGLGIALLGIKRKRRTEASRLRRPSAMLAKTLSMLAVTSAAQADLVVTDPMTRATITVSDAPSPATGFVTYTFSVEPVVPVTEIASIEASFSATTMRQVNPGGLPTVFNDLNGSFPTGEFPAGDSQFTFSLLGGDVLAVGPTESSSSLSAAFTLTGVPLIQFGAPQPFVQVVLPGGDFGTADLQFVVSAVGSAGLGGEIAEFSGLSFGGVVAVPEASTVVVWSLLTVGAVGRGLLTRSRRKAQAAMRA